MSEESVALEYEETINAASNPFATIKGVSLKCTDIYGQVN